MVYEHKLFFNKYAYCCIESCKNARKIHVSKNVSKYRGNILNMDI